MGRRKDDGKITGLSVWDGSPASAPPVRWSEIASPVVPRQTIVAVEVESAASTETGVAALTHYAEPEGPTWAAPELESLLSGWLEFPIRALPHHPSTHNAYEPWTNPIGATVALAALDALGRATQLPAATFLGGVCRSKIPAYASLPSFPDAQAAVACAASALDAGFRTVKFHGSGMLDIDLETVSKARGELGPSTQLIWDGSRAYELHSAEVIGHALAEEGFLWLEAALDDSVAALYRLARRLKIPLVPDGMAQRSAGDWARDLRDGIWGALRLDVTRVESLPAGLRVVRLAESWGVPCEIQSFGFPLSQYANLQLMLATPACRFFEAPFPQTDFHDGLVTAPSIVDGFVTIPDSPGLGHGIETERFSEACKLLARLD